MAMQATPDPRAFPRELAWAGILGAIVLIAAVLLGQARVLPSPTGLPFQVDQKTMEMQRVAP
jgi:hypothetical protein